MKHPTGLRAPLGMLPMDNVFPLFLPVSRAWQLWLVYLTVSWLIVWGGHFLLRRASTRYDARPWPWHRLLGLVLVLFPFVRITYGFLVSIPDVIATGTVATARPPAAWWRSVRQNMVIAFLVPLAGLFLASGFGAWFLQRPERVRSALRSTLAGVGMWPRHSWMRDIATGCALAVVVFFGYIALHVLLAPLQELDTGDASQVFLRITLPLAFALAVMSGLTEEFLYRGILVVKARGLLPRVPTAIVVLAAATVFGLAHAGYGTIANILFPFLFGVLMGFLVIWVGMWPAVIVHGFVNLMIFLAVLATRPDPDPAAGGAMLVVLALAVVVPLVHFGALLLRKWTKPPRGDAGGIDPSPSPPPEPTRSDLRNA